MRNLTGLLVLVCLSACTKDQPGAAGPGSGSDRVCTEIGCIQGLTIALEKATPWPAGNYAFVFDLDGAAVTCKGALPLKACDAGASLVCDPAGKVQIGESGCALAPEAQGFSDIHVAEAPRAVALKISRDDQPVHEAKLAPVYRTTRPNGEGCEPVCNSAGERVALP